MSETLENIRTFASFPFALRRFLRHRMTLDDAREAVLDRMRHREENFLRMIARAVYGNATSPYLRLLKMAGCELGDLRNLVKQKGIEGALRELREAGVYVTLDEFRGRKPITRNGLAIQVRSRDFNNPSSTYSYVSESGGSTGAPMESTHDLMQYVVRASQFALVADAYGIFDTPAVTWLGILPASSFGFMLQRALLGRLPVRWFSHIGLFDSKHWVKYDLGTYFLLFCLRFYNVGVPFPRFVPLSRASIVAQYVANTRRKFGHCVLHAHVSPVLRACLAAKEAGLGFDGVTIIGGGEAPTPAKVNEILQTGARFYSNYAMAGTGNIGYGCPTAHDKSDIHLFKDALALITHPHAVEGIGMSVPTFHFTTLLDTSPKIMLNFEADDYGTIVERSCGCDLESVGYTTHLSGVRSYRKLTGEGVTLIGSEMLRILEQTLPARFGGSSLDYQLLEEEDNRGFTRLSLVISPRIEIPDEQSVIKCVLDALRGSSQMADTARVSWQQAHTLAVKRQEPVWTGRGKLMPLHLERNHPG
jgi:phenylacetate-coenzyme A ligase PaaK-like adenylate-forming protein